MVNKGPEDSYQEKNNDLRVYKVGEFYESMDG